MDVGVIKASKVFSSKKAEARSILAALENAWKNVCIRPRILLDTREVVQALKGGYSLSIIPIILDTKALTSLFLSIDFDYIPRALNGQAHRLVKVCDLIGQDVGWQNTQTPSLVLFPDPDIVQGFGSSWVWDLRLQ